MLLGQPTDYRFLNSFLRVCRTKINLRQGVNRQFGGSNLEVIGQRCLKCLMSVLNEPLYLRGYKGFKTFKTLKTPFWQIEKSFFVIRSRGCIKKNLTLSEGRGKSICLRPSFNLPNLLKVIDSLYWGCCLFALRCCSSVQSATYLSSDRGFLTRCPRTRFR